MLFKGSIRALLVLSLASPAGAFALGLGDIRLLSPLDAPLNAEVEVVDASPDELNTLQAQIASRETFARYGLDYPSYLSDVQAQSVRTADGRQVIQLKSNEPIHQAYLTLLVEVNWARGRTVREYTMLLDPPVYTPGGKNAPAPAPVAAAAAGVDTRGGEIARNTPSPIQAEPPPAAPPPAEATQSTQEPPVAEQPPVAALAPKSAQRSAATPEPEEDTADQDQQDTQKPAGGGQHVVKRGETLSQIAADQAQSDPRSVQTQTWMLAIYRANPDAFDGSMNSLRNHSVLRMPEATELAAISPAEAADEVHRAYMAWRSSVAGAPGSSQLASARPAGKRALKLVVPKEPIAPGGEDAPEGTTAQSGSGDSNEAPIKNPSRLAPAKSQQLAALQKRLSDSSSSSEPAEEEPSARTGVGVDLSGRAASAESATALPPESAPAPERPAPAPPKPGSLPVASFMSSAMNLVRNMWWAGAAALMGLVLVVALRSWRSRRQAEFDDSLNRLALAGSGLGPLSVEHGFTTNDGMGPLEGVVDEPFTVEDTGRFPVTASRAPIAEDLPPVRSNEAPQGFQDGSDPLAEADFHIGYGMYDQAAELLRAAVEHEPGRRDLRLKLLEVYFETGNRDEFLQLAEELVHTRDQAGPGEWEKIAIMGRQLAPEDPLFAESDDFNAAAAGVDLDLEAGDQQVDYDLGGVPDEQQVEFDNAMLDEGLAQEGSLETDIDYSRAPPATMLRQPQVGAAEPDGAFELELDSQDGELDIESALQEAELELNSAQGPDSDATMVAGFDERSRRVMEAAAQRRALQDTALVEEEPEAADPMDQWAAHEDIDSMPMDAGATDASQLGNLRGAARADRDRGRYDLNDAANGPYANGEALAEDDMALPDLEPVTMSEVGTKLDLARAYVDMGDPEGARNILEEVLNEGSLAQKQEAQLLLEGLPG